MPPQFRRTAEISIGARGDGRLSNRDHFGNVLHCRNAKAPALLAEALMLVPVPPAKHLQDNSGSGVVKSDWVGRVTVGGQGTRTLVAVATRPLRGRWPVPTGNTLQTLPARSVYAPGDYSERSGRTTFGLSSEAGRLRSKAAGRSARSTLAAPHLLLNSRCCAGAWV